MGFPKDSPGPLMIRLLNRLGGALLLTLPLLAQAETDGQDYQAKLPPNPSGAQAVVTKLFSQNLLFFVPTRFVRADASTGKDQYIREYVLKGETTQRWTQMITLTASRDAIAQGGVTPRGMLAVIAQGYRDDCPDTFAAADLGETVVTGHPAQLAVVGCGVQGKERPAHGEQTLIIAIQGEQDLYTLQWAERTAPARLKPRFDTDRLQARVTELMPLRLCATTREQPPFADCLRTPVYEDSAPPGSPLPFAIKQP